MDGTRTKPEAMGLDGIPKRLLVALGGDAAHADDLHGGASARVDLADEGALALLPVALACPGLVVTHGGGWLAATALLRQIDRPDAATPVRMDVCVADIQGGFGYLLAQALGNAMAMAGHRRPVTFMLTEVEVDAADPAFAAPGKPVGPFVSDDMARALAAAGLETMLDSTRGWRLVMPSPEPRAMPGLAGIELALGAGHVVVAAGAGGIPVVRQEGGMRRAVQALVDEDLTAALLARMLGMDVLMFLGAVPRIAVRYRQPGEQWLDEVRAGEIRRFLAEGQFARHRMEPKVAAALRFIAAGGRRVIVAHRNEAIAALKGEAGTQIVAD